MAVLAASSRDADAVTLRPLTADNWRACAELTVRDDQRLLLPSNLHSFAAARFYPDNCAGHLRGQSDGPLALYGLEKGRRVRTARAI